MKTIVGQAAEMTDEVISAFSRLRGRVEELRRRHDLIPAGTPRKGILKIQLDAADERMAERVPQVVLLCYRWGMEAGKISARIGVDFQTVREILEKNPDQRRLTTLAGDDNEVSV